jgi:hypothetical protein
MLWNSKAALARKRTDLAEYCALIRRHGFCFDLTGDASVLGGKWALAAT